jgi:hypothetical protein
MNKILMGFSLAVGLLLLGGTSVSADTMPTPGGGPNFGQHVAAMSPGNGGVMPGAAFGACISAMAELGLCNCPCACPMP